MFDSWCDGCGIHIGQGTRYNAQKKKVDMYMSTVIYEFQMKCHFCPQIFIIRTDPKNNTYEYISGIRKKMKEYEASSAETEEIDQEKQFQLRNDRIMALEQVKDDYNKSQEYVPSIEKLISLREEEDDFSKLNRKARDSLREDRKKRKILESEKEKFGWSIPLLSNEELGLPETKKLKTHIIPTIPASKRPLLDNENNSKTKKVENLLSKAIEGRIRAKNFHIVKEKSVMDCQPLKVNTKVKCKDKSKKSKSNLFSYAL